jgi:hypothetical protein
VQQGRAGGFVTEALLKLDQGAGKVGDEPPDGAIIPYLFYTQTQLPQFRFGQQ